MENIQQQPKPGGEVDVLEFMKWIGRGFDRVGHKIVSTIAYLRELLYSNLKLFFFSVVIGTSIGVLFFGFIKEKTYRSSIVVRCEFFNNQIVKNTVEKLNSLCASPSRTGLATELGISDTLARTILEFRFEPFVSEQEIVELEVLKEQLMSVAEEKKELADKIINRIDIENKYAYKFTVLFSKPQAVKKIEQPLVSYFKNSPYIKRRIEVNDMIRIERKNKLLRESLKLDSLRKVIYSNYSNLTKSDRGSNNVILNDEQSANPLDVMREDLLINEQILELETQLFLKPDFEVIDGFTVFSEPETPGLFKIIAVSFFLSIAVCYLALFLFQFDRILAKYPISK